MTQEQNNSNSTRDNLVSSTSKMALATSMSRVLGLIREQVIAYFFGASSWADVFQVAYRIPNLMRDLFAEGAFSSAFVPNFVKARQESEEKARDLFATMIIFLGIILISICLLMAFFAQDLVTLFAPRFKENPSELLISTRMVQIMSPFLFFISMSALMMGVLNSLKVFFLPALTPAFFNIIFISVVALGYPFLKEQGINEVYLLAFAVLFGGMVQMLAQVPKVVCSGYGFIVKGKFLKKEALKILTLLGPGLLGFAFNQINLLVQTVMATQSGIGAISWLNYAFRLFQLPIGVFSVSIGNSHLVHFSIGYKKGDLDGALESIKESIFLSLALLFPPLVFLLFYHQNLVEIIFERGNFLTQDSVQTGKALFYYSLGLPAYGMYKIFSPSFYTMDKPHIPVFCSLLVICLNIVFCYSLIESWGFWVLALGTSLSMYLNSFLLTFLFKKYLPHSQQISLYFSKRNLKLLIGMLVSSLGLYGLSSLEVSFKSSLLLKCIWVFINIVFVMLIFHMSLYFLNEKSLVNFVLKRIKK
jgi:putative peptidoglycan lipid II flippase